MRSSEEEEEEEEWEKEEDGYGEKFSIIVESIEDPLISPSRARERKEMLFPSRISLAHSFSVLAADDL